MRSDFILRCTLVKSSRTIEAVAIHQRHRWHFESNGAFCQSFRLGTAFEEGKGTVGVQFDVAVSHKDLPHTTSSARSRASAGTR